MPALATCVQAAARWDPVAAIGPGPGAAELLACLPAVLRPDTDRAGGGSLTGADAVARGLGDAKGAAA